MGEEAVGINPCPDVLQMCHARLPVARNHFLPRRRVVDVDVRVVCPEVPCSTVNLVHERARRRVYLVVVAGTRPRRRQETHGERAGPVCEPQGVVLGAARIQLRRQRLQVDVPPDACDVLYRRQAGVVGVERGADHGLCRHKGHRCREVAVSLLPISRLGTQNAR